MRDPFKTNPCVLENFYAYPQGHKHYGKLKMKLNYNDYKLGEEIAVDTKQARIEGIVEFMEGNIVVIKMTKLIHKELPS